MEICDVGKITMKEADAVGGLRELAIERNREEDDVISGRAVPKLFECIVEFSNSRRTMGNIENIWIF